MNKGLQVLTLGAVALLFSACASSSSQQNTLINDPSLLKQSTKDESVYSYIKEDTNFKQYSRVLVPQIQIKNDNENKIDTALVREISNYFTSQLSNNLNGVVKNNPGNETLILEVGIDSVDVGYEKLKVWQFIPISLAVTAISRGTGIADKDLNVAIALRLTDQQTKSLIAMAVDTRKKEGIKKAEELQFSDVKPLLDKWVVAITNRLEELNN